MLKTKNNLKRNLTALVLIGLAFACKKPYTPAEIVASYNYLVVEGIVNSGSDSTFIRLSRTTRLTKGTTVVPELKAVVSVENEQNVSYALKELTNGNYTAAGLNLDGTKKYRLRIKTTAGKTYLSDFVEVKNAPVIDSIGFKVTSDGMDIYNNAHDNTSNTRYYRWDYQETWEFNARYFSTYITDGKQLLTRTAAQQIHHCWGNASSANILLNSTVKLTQDVLYQNIITSIPYDSEKIGIKYSILLKQYALTKEAYSFWDQLRKNTEQLGSIFDSQPSALTGNIHNVADAAEPVIGFVSVGIVQSKRIFIPKSALPSGWRVKSDILCSVDTALFFNPYTKANNVKEILIPKSPETFAIDSLPMNVGYTYSSRSCLDCTLRGVVKQPAFWK